MPRARVDLPTLLALTSALAAGAEELAWSRLLGRVVGHGSLALGLTLAIFMAGQGLGALLAPRVRSNAKSARHAFVLAEFVTAASALGVLALAMLAPLPSAAIGLDGGSLALGFDVVVAGLVTLVPAVAMGAALPLLAEASSGAGAPSLARLYAAGLVGVVAGTLGGATLAAPALGLDTLALAAAGVHCVVALGARGLGSPNATPQVIASPEAVRTHRPGVHRTAALRFAVASAVGLGLQPIWARSIVPYAGVASLTFASIVAAYVASQALGFGIWSKIRARRIAGLAADDAALLSAAPLGLATLAALTPLSVLAPARTQSALVFALGTPLIVLAIVGPTALALGVAQAGALARVEGSDAARGARLGWVSGVGTLAGAAAALLSATVALPLLGPRLGIAAFGALAAALVGLEHLGPLALGLAVVAGLVVTRLGPDDFLGPSYDQEELVYVEHGWQDTTAVVRHVSPIEGSLLRLVSGGVSYSGDSRFAQRYMRLLAHLPALAAEGRRRALVVCVGTGTTLDALRLHDFERIDAVDLSPSVERTLEHFAHVHHDVTSDERVRFVTADGARHLRITRHVYDVITLEPPPPRAPGASSLYSRELYEAARARLAPGGAIAQWLPLHGLGEREARAIVATFAAVLPEVSIHLVERNEAVLVGRLVGARHDRPLGRAAVDDLRSIGLGGLDAYADTLLVEGPRLRALVEGAPTIRDAWPYPELVPLADAGAGLDVLLEALRDAGGSVDTSATMLAAIAPAFVRLSEGRPQAGDRERVLEGMARVFAARPDDPYWSVLAP